MWTQEMLSTCISMSILIDKVDYRQPILWLAVLVVSLAVESVTSEMVSIWFVPSSLISMILSFFFDLKIQLIVFVVLSVVLVLLAKTAFRNLLKKDNNKTKSGVDQLVGKHVLVVEDIDNTKDAGVVKVNGQLWTARMDINETTAVQNEHVEIVQICGNTLICKKI